MSKIENMPTHIAIIMDGNRRWAKKQKMPANYGHKVGAETLEKLVRFANNIGLKYLTVYAFSTENWKRAEEEVNALMLLLRNYLDKYAKQADTENIKINVLGDITALSQDLQASINKCMDRTKNNTGVTVNIALNYGGRDELVKAIQDIAADVQAKNINVNDITEELISQRLYTKGQPDPDLVIRTSGEYRLSNFLPWQSVYSELLFVDKSWPEFTGEDLLAAIEEYNNRNRRFGGSK